jgi:hypothetical protein
MLERSVLWIPKIHWNQLSILAVLPIMERSQNILGFASPRTCEVLVEPFHRPSSNDWEIHETDHRVDIAVSWVDDGLDNGFRVSIFLGSQSLASSRKSFALQRGDAVVVV